MNKKNISEAAFKHGTYGSKYLFEGVNFNGGYAMLSPGSKIEEHLHEGENEVFYFMEGEPVFKVNGEAFRAKPGDGITVNAGEKHGVENDTGSEVKMVFVKIKG